MFSGLLNVIKNNNILSLSDLKQYLWKDEINDTFLLTKHMEIFLFDNDTLKCFCWSYKIASQLNKKGLIFNKQGSDDNLYIFKIKIENLLFLLNIGKFKKRPNLNGNWLEDKRRKLGHSILTYESILVSTSIQEKALINNNMSTVNKNTNENVNQIELKF